MIRNYIRYAALLGALGVGACSLDVQNPNSPETKRVLGSPRDAESVLGQFYKRWHVAMYGSLSNQWGMSMVQSFEDYSSLANNCMNQRASIPRPANVNTIGNGCGEEQRRTFFIHEEVARVASTVIQQFNSNVNGSFSLGSKAQDLRAKAFGEFLRGLSLGYLALVYDSAAAVSPSGPQPGDADCVPEATSGICLGPLKGYAEVMDSAITALTRAIDTANATSALSGLDAIGGFPLPSNWIPSSTQMTLTEFVKLARSYRARFRANVGRTPAERDAADWASIIADAQNGISADHDNITDDVNGPFATWVSQIYAFGTWHQMSPFVIGMADNSGAYATWIAQPLNDRGNAGAFFMTTSDLRFPQGATRAAQQSDFAITSCNAASTKCKRYFVNRPAGSDQQVGFGWGWSNYDHARFRSWRTNGNGTGARNGPFPFFTKAEIDMLQAEGLIRTGQFAAAATLIDRTRTACGTAGVPAGCTAKTNGEPGGGLPALSGVVLDNATPVPGGTNCVPKVPLDTNGPLACGNLFEAMKWEKRVETAYTHFMAWFLDSRGWGDLPEGTPTDWPVPYDELQARGRPASAIYNTGGFGSGNTHTAAKGTYGW